MSVLTTLVEGFYTLTVGAGPDARSYRVRSLIDQQIQADFARWHFERAVAELLATRPLYSDEEFAAEREKIRAGHRAGLYDFKSAKGAELLGTLPGLQFICARLIVGVDESAVLELVARCEAEIGEVLKQVIRDSFPEALGLGAEKKTRAPAPGPRRHRKT